MYLNDRQKDDFILEILGVLIHIIKLLMNYKKKFILEPRTHLYTLKVADHFTKI